MAKFWERFNYSFIAFPQKRPERPVRLIELELDLEHHKEHIKRLEYKIHRQRQQLRANWEIIEMRAQYKRCWYPSKLLSQVLGIGAQIHRVRPFIQHWEGYGDA